jgi:acetolactate synthase-1/2/3 large subunit
MGVGLNISKTGFNTSTFAHKAKKIVIDIDENQIIKMPIKPNQSLTIDLKDFLPNANEYFQSKSVRRHEEWISLCRIWRDKYDEIDAQVESSQFVNPYYLMKLLSKFSRTEDVIVTGNGLDSVSYCQGFRVKHGQKTIVNGNWGSMGWDLPLAIGAHFASSARVICVTGDGSIMQNIQELLTIGSRKLPVKIFIINNAGYGSIRATQDNYFESRYVGADKTSGVFNPNFSKLAEAFFLAYRYIKDDFELNNSLTEILSNSDSELIELKVSTSQWINTKATSFKDERGTIHSKELDDMFPFLPAAEIEEIRNRAKKIK